MEQKSEKQRYLAEFEDVTPAGLQLGDGIVKTSYGTVRMPKATLKKSKSTKSSPQEVHAPVSIERQGRTPVGSYDKVTFSTDMGDITGLYDPVIDAGDFIVLGLTDNSFVPKSYREAQKLRLLYQHKDAKAYVVYTGCRFTEPALGREYIILMKTGGSNAEETGK